LTIEVTETDRETLEEKTLDTIKLDLSCLLHSSDAISVSKNLSPSLVLS